MPFAISPDAVVFFFLNQGDNFAKLNTKFIIYSEQFRGV